MIYKSPSVYVGIIAGICLALIMPGCVLQQDDTFARECRAGYTIPPRQPDVNYLEFIALGDTGTGAMGQRIVAGSMRKYALERSVRFVLLLGDNFYEDGVSSVDDSQFRTHFEEIYDPSVLSMPFYAVLGNHDYRGDIHAQVAYGQKSARWRMPALYYSFCYRDNEGILAEFFGLDSQAIVDEKNHGPQLAWLQEALKNSQARWKIVFAHHPIYSNGKYDNNQRLLSVLEPLLRENGVDIYLCGHDHNLQVLEPGDGILHLISGAGGKLNSVHCEMSSHYAASFLGFMGFRVTRDEMAVFVVHEDAEIDFALTVSK
jgi:acid phosphatase